MADSSFNQDLAALARLNNAANADRSTLMRIKSQDSDTALKMAATEFAGIFIGKIYKEIAKTVHPETLTNGGAGEEMFRGMLYSEYARQAAYQYSFGLGQTVYRALKQRHALAANP